ncbi:MAG TPA: hypothetical protein VGS12_07350 [Caulobacteraceae bacterium]|nr:hypothetical protein [Caulobacteraceae bacterium]
MGKLTFCVVALAALASACSRPAGGAHVGSSGPGKLPSAALDLAIGQAIGDPTTCVIIFNAADNKKLYQYGQDFNCQRPLPACDRPGTLTGETALAFAAGARMASCNLPSPPGAAVGWAEGKVLGAKEPLVYSAVMDGQRALPGHEMSARMDNVFYNLSL